jgi:hypothetical protein
MINKSLSVSLAPSPISPSLCRSTGAADKYGIRCFVVLHVKSCLLLRPFRLSFPPSLLFDYLSACPSVLLRQTVDLHGIVGRPASISSYILAATGLNESKMRPRASNLGTDSVKNVVIWEADGVTPFIR